MARPPDRYMFKRHFIVRLPVPVFQYLMNREVMAEYSKMESILHHARGAEENARQMLRWYDERQTIQSTKEYKGMASNRRTYSMGRGSYTED